MCHFVPNGCRSPFAPVLLILVALTAGSAAAQRITGLTADLRNEGGPELPFTLQEAPFVSFPAGADSNSPAFWDRDDSGENLLHIMNSAGHPSISEGRRIGRWAAPRPVSFTNAIDGGRWMEAVLQDVDGTLYGYYHNEPASICLEPDKTAPRIGAARSEDGGLTWDDLGIVLEAPPGSERCDTANHYFYGGVGDFSVVLNREQTDAYFLFSAYSGDAAQQGVAIARMLWQHRDEPVGNVALWDGHLWRYPSMDDETEVWLHGQPEPILPAAVSWHAPSGRVDAFWGPSMHWNTYLGKYVMLLNHATTWDWAQEGVYVAFATSLDDPASWSRPTKILSGGSWYPQILGLEPGAGTDKQAGRVARLFVGGESKRLIVFGSSGTP